jgi:iron complex outermembrane receptor protein
MAKKLNWVTAASMFAVTLAGGGQALAQDSETEARAEGGLDEIVVTAQRRQQSVQDVPIPVTAFSPTQLENLNITNTLQLAQYVPNLFAMNNTGLGSANAYFLRGIGNTESIATFDPPVGSYIDDVYITRQNANNFSFFDMERIEVLRGPQGTLFGRNTTGGAVNLILKKPAADFGGFMEFGVGDFDATNARLSLDVPLSDNVRTKVSAYAGQRDGYATNVTTGEKVNGDDNYGLRAAVAVDFAPNLTWDVSVAHVWSDAVNLLNTECAANNPNFCDRRFVATGLTTGAPNTPTGRFTVPVRGEKGGFGLGNETETNMVISNLQWNLSDAWSVNFITGYTDLSQKFALDFFDGRTNAPGFTFAGAVPVPTFSAAQIRPPIQGGPNGGFTIANDGVHQTLTQEVKLQGSLANGLFDVTAGVFYLDEKNKTDFADIFTLGSGFTLLLADRVLENTATATALYAQADWHLTDQLTATVGVRYTDEEKTVAFTDQRAACAASQTATGCVSSANIANASFASGSRIPLSQSEGITTPRFAINFEPTDDILLFASATRGFKSGGWNARGTAVNELLPFDPELIWSYEAGVKSEWFGGKLRANLTYFQAEIEDLQTPSAFVRANGSIAFITRNFADLTNEGFELELQAAPWEGLTLFANAGIQDAQYELKTNAPALDRFGILSTAAQQTECRAARAGAASPGLAGAAFAALSAAARAGNTCGTGIVDPQGNISKPVRAPDLTVAYGFTQEIELGDHGRLVPSISATYYDDSEVGTSNVSIFAGAGGTFNTVNGVFINGSRSQATTIVNASFAWENQAGDLRVSLDCSNCNDEAYVQSTLSNFSYLNPPRMWALRVKADF